MCANDYALNKYLDEQAKFEKTIEAFNDDIKHYLQAMEDAYFEIRRLSYEYDGEDLSDYARETVQNYLGVWNDNTLHDDKKWAI